MNEKYKSAINDLDKYKFNFKEMQEEFVEFKNYAEKINSREKLKNDLIKDLNDNITLLNKELGEL